MRLMLKFTIPVDKGNEALADGTMAPAIEALVKKVNAEAAYFMVLDGERAAWCSSRSPTRRGSRISTSRFLPRSTPMSRSCRR